MSEQTIRIATRKSPLAMWQAEHVAAALRQAHPDLAVEILGMSTQGDKILDTPLAKIGGKGLFVKELEERMPSGDADIAVWNSALNFLAATPEDDRLIPLHGPPQRGMLGRGFAAEVDGDLHVQ